jgi:hypothetical protein
MNCRVALQKLLGYSAVLAGIACRAGDPQASSMPKSSMPTPAPLPPPPHGVQPRSAVVVGCDPALIGYSTSRLGLDYRTMTPSPVAEILSQAEAERISHGVDLSVVAARKKFASEWSVLIQGLLAGTLPRSFTGAAEPSLDDFRALTPKALAQLKRCGPQADARLTYLREVSLSLGTENE